MEPQQPTCNIKERSGLLFGDRLAGVYRFNGLLKWMKRRYTLTCMCLNGRELTTADCECENDQNSLIVLQNLVKINNSEQIKILNFDAIFKNTKSFI